jgi:hypothetical protein
MLQHPLPGLQRHIGLVQPADKGEGRPHVVAASVVRPISTSSEATSTGAPSHR